eukprot:3519570-Lingulodinium_polyedra.AAC.1
MLVIPVQIQRAHDLPSVGQPRRAAPPWEPSPKEAGLIHGDGGAHDGALRWGGVRAERLTGQRSAQVLVEQREEESHADELVTHAKGQASGPTVLQVLQESEGVVQQTQGHALEPQVVDPGGDDMRHRGIADNPRDKQRPREQGEVDHRIGVP